MKELKGLILGISSLLGHGFIRLASFFTAYLWLEKDARYY
jgi:hypothetical protein